MQLGFAANGPFWSEHRYFNDDTPFFSYFHALVRHSAHRCQCTHCIRAQMDPVLVLIFCLLFLHHTVVATLLCYGNFTMSLWRCIYMCRTQPCRSCAMNVLQTPSKQRVHVVAG